MLAHPQELGENAVDSAHFRYVHNTADVPEITSYVTDGPVADMRSIQRFPTPRGVVEGKIESTGYGPGVSIIRFAGIIDTLLVSSTTPVDQGSCQTRFDFYTRSLGDAKTNEGVAKAFVAEVDKQFLEDMPIWEHKAHIARPALADTDGPFMTFRKWYAAVLRRHGDARRRGRLGVPGPLLAREDGRVPRQGDRRPPATAADREGAPAAPRTGPHTGPQRGSRTVHPSAERSSHPTATGSRDQHVGAG